MTSTIHAERLRAMAFPRVFDAHKLIVGFVYLAAYAVLDWISFIEPYAQLGITPWNPGTGLSFVLLLLFGLRMIPFLLVSPLLADFLNQQFAMPWYIEILASALVGGGYSIAVAYLLRPKSRFDPTLASMHDLVLLLVVAVVSAAFVAVGYVSLTIAAGLLPAADFTAAALRYWVGDVIGITVIAPFALFALTRRRILPMTTETLLQFIAIGLALALVFGLAEEQQFQLFYVLFLPIVWLAVRTGSEGVSVGILVTQLGLILGIQLFPAGTFDVTAFQALMLVLAMTGLVAGELVTERRRTEAQLRLQQDSHSRLARLGSMGELAAAVAHELNQPLMAAGTYTRLVNDAMSTAPVDVVTVAETAKKAVAQVERAAEVVRHLRALVRLDRSNRAPCRFERIVEETIELCQPDLDRMHVTVRTAIAADLPPIMVDLLQIEQVLINLLRNAIEAIGESETLRGTVLIDARVFDAGFVEVRVIDSGPGFPAQLVENAFLPLSSHKAEGLGIGLPLCRSIVEAHGGKLWLDDGSQGATVHFTLPIAKTA
ncbi:MAG TPA: MASE1 domain-containing protein [Pseudolabrys sp.]|jgi:signal transduction histidine kinase|nr:MASE1 domain-containing protein [Pseudolabrys sp.]